MRGEIKKQGQWRNIKITYYESGLLFFEPVSDGELGMEDLDEYKAYVKSIVGEDRTFILTDLRSHYFKLSREVMEKFANDPFSKHLRIADAIVLGSVFNRLLVNFYMKVFKPKEPTKIFTSMEAAEEWLKEKKEEMEI